MRSVLALTMLALLCGCSVARKATGLISNIGDRTSSVENAGASEAATTDSSARLAIRGVLRADDMDKIAQRVPGGLIGDTQNAVHSGDPVTPQ